MAVWQLTWAIRPWSDVKSASTFRVSSCTRAGTSSAAAAAAGAAPPPADARPAVSWLPSRPCSCRAASSWRLVAARVPSASDSCSLTGIEHSDTQKVHWSDYSDRSSRHLSEIESGSSQSGQPPGSHQISKKTNSKQHECRTPHLSLHCAQLIRVTSALLPPIRHHLLHTPSQLVHRRQVCTMSLQTHTQKAKAF